MVQMEILYYVKFTTAEMGKKKKKKSPKGLGGPVITLASFLTAGVGGCCILPALRWLFLQST